MRVVRGEDDSNREITITLTLREYAELLDVLRRAEDLSVAARHNELDFRMQRSRFERRYQGSRPPVSSLGTQDTKYIDLKDLMALIRKPVG